jgi:hypothetical protein
VRMFAVLLGVQAALLWHLVHQAPRHLVRPLRRHARPPHPTTTTTPRPPAATTACDSMQGLGKSRDDRFVRLAKLRFLPSDLRLPLGGLVTGCSRRVTFTTKRDFAETVRLHVTNGTSRWVARLA